MEIRTPQDYIGDDFLRFCEENDAAIRERALQRAAAFYQNTTLREMTPKFRAGEREHGGLTLAKLHTEDFGKRSDEELTDNYFYTAFQMYKDFAAFLEAPTRSPLSIAEG